MGGHQSSALTATVRGGLTLPNECLRSAACAFLLPRTFQISFICTFVEVESALFGVSH